MKHVTQLATKQATPLHNLECIIFNECVTLNAFISQSHFLNFFFTYPRSPSCASPLNGNRSSKTLESSLTMSRNKKKKQIRKRRKICFDAGLEPNRFWPVPNNERRAGWFFRLLNCHHRATGRRSNLRLGRLISKFFV